MRLSNAQQFQVPRIVLMVEMYPSRPTLFDSTNDRVMNLAGINFGDISFRHHFTIGARKQMTALLQ